MSQEDANLLTRYYALDGRNPTPMEQAVAEIVKINTGIATKVINRLLQEGKTKTFLQTQTASWKETREMLDSLELEFRQRHPRAKTLPTNQVAKIIIRWTKEKKESQNA